MTEQQTSEQQNINKRAITARVPDALFQDIEAISWGLSRPGAIVANGTTLAALATHAIAGIRTGKLRASDFTDPEVGRLFSQTLRLAGQPPTEETDEQRRKREAEEAAENGPGPVGRPQRGKGIVVGEGPKSGPKKAGRR